MVATKTKLVNHSLELPFDVGEEVKVKIGQGRTKGYTDDIFLIFLPSDSEDSDAFDNFEDLQKAFGALSSCRYQKIKHSAWHGYYLEKTFRKGITDTNYDFWISTDGEVLI